MTIRLTRDDIMHVASRPKGAASGAIWDAYVAALTSTDASSLFDRYEINSPLRMQHLLATMTCETNLSIIWESGAYSKAGILRVFGVGHHSSAVTDAEAAHIASLPVNADGSGPRCEVLFERVYGYLTKIGRSMGNIEPGDGWKHRGLGLNQQTGRASQQAAANKVGCSLEDLQKPLNLIRVALIEWQEKRCNVYADRDDAVSIRKLINGGSLKVSISRINGLPQAQAALRLAKAVITPADFSDTMIAEQDVPTISNVPANEDKPATLYSSTEMHAGATGTLASGATAASKAVSFMPRAFSSATSTGRFSFTMFVFALLGDPEFWEAAGATLAAGGCIYLMIMRFKRFHIFGV